MPNRQRPNTAAAIPNRLRRCRARASARPNRPPTNQSPNSRRAQAGQYETGSGGTSSVKIDAPTLGRNLPADAAFCAAKRKQEEHLIGLLSHPVEVPRSTRYRQRPQGWSQPPFPGGTRGGDRTDRQCVERFEAASDVPATRSPHHGSPHTCMGPAGTAASSLKRRIITGASGGSSSV
jgi:hypothetical protein